MHGIGAAQLWHTGNNELMIHCLNHNTDCLEEKRQILIDELASQRVGHIDDQNDAGQTAWAAIGDPKNRVVNWPCDEAREKATAAAASRAADNDDDDDDEPDPGFVTRRLKEEV